MKTLKKFAPVLLFCLLASGLQAAVTPWIGSLAANGSFTVPAGKVLVIEQVGCGVATNAISRVTVSGTYLGGIGSGTFSIPVSLGVISNSIVKLPSPIRLGAGMTISNSTTLTLSLFGLAADAADYTFLSPK